MGGSFASEVLKKNWHLLLVLVIVLVVIAVKLTMRDTTPAPAPVGARAATGSGAVSRPAAPAATPKRLTPGEEALATIAEHQTELQADPKGEKAPSLLLSIGNLYMQKLQDYDQAIGSYERILVEYPQWSAIHKAYTQLAIAYQNSGNTDKARSVYEEMMRRYPQDSTEYKYAQAQLQTL